MHRSYADTTHGQVHVRTAGDGPRTLMLVHWTPLSGRMFEGITPFFVAAGYRVVAPDLLGYGRSDARPTDWSMAAWADNLAEVLDALGIAEVVALGGHNGASIALELAVGHPQRVSAVVLDGPPVLTDELRAAFSALVKATPPTVGQDVFDRTVGLLSEYIPGYRPEGDGLSLLWPAMIDYLETNFVPSAAIAGKYDISARLPLLEQPSLLLGAENDSLAATFEQACALLSPTLHHKFAGHHPIHFADRHAEYAGVVIDFLAGSPASV